MQKNIAVLGLNFGDEGKGITVARLCEENEDPLVVRFSGGPQASHKVMTKDKEHISSTFGSGVLGGFPTALTSDVAVDIYALLNEYNVLVKKGIDPKLYIDPKCPVITNYDMQCNQEDSKNLNDGTCGIGFGKTIERNENLVTLTVGDIVYYPDVTITKLDIIKDYYRQRSANNFMLILFDKFRELLNENDNIRIANFKSVKTIYKTNIWEGSQGVLLDKNIGFFPYVTRSNTDLTNVNKHNIFIDELNVVSRSYLTRHGNGPTYPDAKDLPFLDSEYEHNVENQWQGSFRKYLLNIDLMKYAIFSLKVNINTKTILNITHMDEVAKFNRMYIVNGEQVKLDEYELSNILIDNLLLSNLYMYDSPKIEGNNESD